METIDDYRVAFLALAENCRKKFGADSIEVYVYERGEVKFVLK